MKLVAVMRSRVFWLFNLDEVRPVEGVYLPEFVEYIANSFNFVKPPTKETWGQGLVFEHGRYISPQDGRAIIVSNMTMQTMQTGFVMIEVESTTEDGEEVLNAVISMVISKGFREPVSKTTMLFHTALVADLDKSIDVLVNDYDEVSSVISRYYPYEAPARVHSFQFRLDPTALPAELAAHNPTTFYVEVRSGATYDQKRYYVEANLRTKDALSLLEELEGHL